MTPNASLTDYIATRWYRAPEVILSQRQYTAAIDVWSVGCILAELIRRRPLLPAQTEQEQMMMISNLIGRPTDAIINEIEDERIKEFMIKLPHSRGQNFRELFKGANEQAIDMLKRMLVFDPEQRITIDQALEHPYLEHLHLAEDEPRGEPVKNFDFDFELYSLKIDEYKQLIYEEIQLYHHENLKKAY